MKENFDIYAKEPNVQPFNPHRGVRWVLGVTLALAAVCFLGAFLFWLRHVAHESPLPDYLTNAPTLHRHR